jgi:uncharacterized membrane protein
MDEMLVVLMLIAGLAAGLGALLGIVALARINGLERRIRGLEQQSARPAIQSRAPEAPAVDAIKPRGDSRPVAARGSTATRSRRSWLDLEQLIGGRLLNRVGIAALLFGTAFFIKYAFNNAWIGPQGRVLIGLVCGAALIGYGQWLLRRGYTYFSEGIAGLGAGVIYLSIFAAWSFYELASQPVAFAGMVVNTALIVALALRRDSQRLATLGLIGGLLTPGLISSGADQQVALFGYLLILGGGMLAVTWRRNWRFLPPIALFGTLLYFVGWCSAFYDASRMASTLSFAALFFALFAVLPLARARRGKPLLPEQIAVVLVDACWLTVTLFATLYNEHRWALTGALLSLAGAHLAASRLAAPARGAASRMLYGGLALTLATIVLPVRLEGQWITIGLAVESAALIWAGLRGRATALRAFGAALWIPALLLLFSQPLDSGRVLLNERFWTIAVVAGGLAASYWLARRRGNRLLPGEHRVYGVAGIVANVLAVWALSMECWDFAGGLRGFGDPALTQHLVLSLFWVVYAAVWIVIGVRRPSAPTRWQGLALMGLAVGKVFLVDLSFLERGFRILSFCGLGLVLLVVSFLYQRMIADGEKLASR